MSKQARKERKYILELLGQTEQLKKIATNSRQQQYIEYGEQSLLDLLSKYTESELGMRIFQTKFTTGTTEITKALNIMEAVESLCDKYGDEYLIFSLTQEMDDDFNIMEHGDKLYVPL